MPPMTTTPTTNDPAVLTPSSSLVEIDSGLTSVRAVTFSADGRYILNGGKEGVRVWCLSDGKEVARIAVEHVRCLAVSHDGRWIAAGTFSALLVWDATSFSECVFAHTEPYPNSVEFSPDSSQLVAGSLNSTASVWNVQQRQRVVGPLKHDDVVIATKYSPQGTRIAIATPNSLYVYNTDGSLLVGPVPLRVVPWFDNGLLWESNDHLLVVSDGTIRKIDASTGVSVSDIPVPESNTYDTCIALPQHGQFVAYASRTTLYVWDTATRAQLARMEQPQSVRSIARSSDDRLLALAGEYGKITVLNMMDITESIPLPRLHPTFLEPDIQIDDAVLELWKCGRLENAEALLTTAVDSSQNPDHHLLAGRALVRTRLRDWDAALRDAEQSLTLRPSVAGYIAKSLALVGKGEKYDGYRACDSAFERFHSAHVSFILLTKAVIAFIAGDPMDAISRVDELVGMVKFNSICYVVQAHMHFLLGMLRMDHRDYEDALEHFARARAQMRRHSSRSLSMISLISGWKFDELDTTIRKQQFDALYATGRTKEARESLLEMRGFLAQKVNVSADVTKWLSDSVQRCLADSGNGWSQTTPTPLLVEWVKLKLASSSWKDVVSAARNFTAPKFAIYRALCEGLIEKETDAFECFSQMTRELGTKDDLLPEQAKWITESKQRFAKAHEQRGEAAAAAQRYGLAISEYSSALSLQPTSQELHIKRGKMNLLKGWWNDALNDATQAIDLDPSSPWGYEMKHTALHEAREFGPAIDAYKTMLSKMASSSDPEIRRRRNDYIDPSETIAVIDSVIQDATRDLPRVLISTESGRLCTKSDQVKSFRSQKVFDELISSMTTRIDSNRIKQEVERYYRYATFSHKWEEHEPLFNEIMHVAVYDLEESPTHHKLQMFCKIVRDGGLHWAWSDTCCIDKGDHVVIQEALVSMFKWYESSTMTIVHLRDVHATGRRGDLVDSIWNKRAWTFQEYHASKVVRFYTNDWKPYLGLDVPNHKSAHEIVSEMEEATGVPAQTLMSLHPDLYDIRDKLRLASGRQTTYIEDSAYSLLGIFSMSLPITYGDRDKALGKLLAQLLTNSADTSILAWTGKSGSYNSCLPESITVFEKSPTTHIPQVISSTDMDKRISDLRGFSFDHAENLYRRLDLLSTPIFTERRMRLPCLKFKLGRLSRLRDSSEHGYRAMANELGHVEIHTQEDLSRYDPLYIVHPWIDHLLGRHPFGSAMETTTPEGSIDGVSDASTSPGPSRRRHFRLVSRFTMPLRPRTAGGTPAFPDTASVRPPTPPLAEEHRTRVLECVVRLKEPFGALLLTPKHSKTNTRDLKRVATDCEVRVKLQESVSLRALMACVDVVDVL